MDTAQPKSLCSQRKVWESCSGGSEPSWLAKESLPPRNGSALVSPPHTVNGREQLIGSMALAQTQARLQFVAAGASVNYTPHLTLRGHSHGHLWTIIIVTLIWDPLCWRTIHPLISGMAK